MMSDCMPTSRLHRKMTAAALTCHLLKHPTEGRQRFNLEMMKDDTMRLKYAIQSIGDYGDTFIAQAKVKSFL